MASGILTELDWDEGFAMPVANAENKALEDMVMKNQWLIIQNQNEESSLHDRIIAMNDHLRNVRQELQHTQGLLNARQQELQTEIHMMKIAEREEGRLKQEITRLQRDLEDLKEKKNMFENNIFKQTSILEEMKSQMNWDHQALEAWLEESARKDEDTMVLQKYTRHDEGKIKEVSMRIEHLTVETRKKRRLLEHETTLTQTTQLELDKTAEEFRKAHADRQDLITQWEHTIEQMQKRDEEMNLLAAKIANVKQEVRNRHEIIKEKRQFLENEVDNNKEEEKKISLAERTAAKVRIEQRKAEHTRVQFQDELDALKRTVERTALDLETTRTQVSQLKQDVEYKKEKYARSETLKKQLMGQLGSAINAELTAEERAAEMEKLLADEERRQNEVDWEVKNLHEMKFKKTQDLHDAQVSERNVEAEIQGSRAAIRNLNSNIIKLDHDSLKQQEIVYNQDFAIQQLERRITRMQGERSNEEKLALEVKIKELTEELDKKNSMYSLLDIQRKRLQDDIRRVKRGLEKSGQHNDGLTSKIEELELYNENSQMELKGIINTKEDKMVDANLLKLEIKRLRENLNNKADNVMTMEKRRLQLETAMKERHHEITIHMGMLKAQIRAADTERQTVSAELHERISKIDKLKNRYEILMVSMAPPEGEAEKSQAYYVIKAAQEKEELQSEGDELDGKIRKAEKEIRALENTLRLMNSRNEQYRKSFNRVTETSDEMEEKERNEEQLRAVMDKYKYKRRQIRELQDDLQTMSYTLENLSRDESAYVQMMEQKQNKILILNKELSEQRAKMDRVTKQNAKYSRETRYAAKSKDETPDERDFALRESREFNRTISKQIGEVVHENSEITRHIHLHFTQANLLPPPNPSQSPGSQCSQSSLSSARSYLVSVGSSVSGSTVKSAVTPVNIGASLVSPPRSSRSSVSSHSSVGRR